MPDVYQEMLRESGTLDAGAGERQRKRRKVGNAGEGSSRSTARVGEDVVMEDDVVEEESEKEFIKSEKESSEGGSIGAIEEDTDASDYSSEEEDWEDVDLTKQGSVPPLRGLQVMSSG